MQNEWLLENQKNMSSKCGKRGKSENTGNNTIEKQQPKEGMHDWIHQN